MQAKILTIDIETAPHIAHVWGLWKQNVGLSQIKEQGYVMSFSAKWLGDDKVYYEENRDGNDKRLVKSMVRFLDEADIVIAHNAKRFDIPTILGRAVVHRLAPPSPFKIIDTLIVAKKEFRFPSNKLEYIANALGCAPKKKHAKFPGFELWLQCLKQNDEAWAEMRDYNIQDVVSLEEVYLRMRPYIRNHPNVAVMDEDKKLRCPKCSSTHIHLRGFYHTNVGKYRKFQCQDCKGWGSSRYTEYPQDKRHALLKSAM